MTTLYDPLEEQFFFDGRLERRVMTPQWGIPKDIELVDDDRLEWTRSQDRELAKPRPELFAGFLRLRDASGSKILAYARRCGVLGLCNHDFPYNHPVDCWWTLEVDYHPCPFDERGRLTSQALEWDRYLERLELHEDEHGSADGFAEEPPQQPYYDEEIGHADVHFCFPRGFLDGGSYWEPLSAWRMWAGRAHALLLMADSVQNGETPSPDDWYAATGQPRPVDDDDPADFLPPPATVSEGRLNVEIFANNWLAATSVRPLMQHDGDRLHLMLGSGGLFGAIALQLSLAISGTKSFAICDVCKNVYAPTMAPKAGQRHYCVPCRKKKEPQKHAAREYRKRNKKDQRQKRKKGM